MRAIVGLFHNTYIVSAKNFSCHRWTENIGKMVAWCQVPDHDRLRCPCHRRHWSWGGWRRGQDQVWSSSCPTAGMLPPPSHPACTGCSRHLSELKLFLGYIRCHTCLVWGKGETVKIHPWKKKFVQHFKFSTVQHNYSGKIQTFPFNSIMVHMYCFCFITLCMCQQKASEIFIVVSSEDGHWDADAVDGCDMSTDDIRGIVSLPTDQMNEPLTKRSGGWTRCLPQRVPRLFTPDWLHQQLHGSWLFPHGCQLSISSLKWICHILNFLFGF